MSPDAQNQSDGIDIPARRSPASPDGPTRMNRYQLESARAIAAQKIEAALQEFAAQLPQGALFVQEAFNAAGAILDTLERRTQQYDAGAQLEPDTDENPDMAQHRADIAGVEESDEIKDFNMS